MPIYTISHVVPLSPQQRDQIAARITTIHKELFTTPSFFVNVKFVEPAEYSYVGGKRRSTNDIHAQVRHGPSRTDEHYEQLCNSIKDAWNEVVGSGETNGTNGHAGDVSKELRGIFVVGGIVAGWENGFMVPPAGGDLAWLKESLPVFERLANEGSEEWSDVVQEVRQRKLLD